MIKSLNHEQPLFITRFKISFVSINYFYVLNVNQILRILLKKIFIINIYFNSIFLVYD